MEIVCRAFINSQGKTLLCKQQTPFRDFWTLPGGSLEEGETLVDCIKRELCEELGTMFDVTQLMYIRELIYPLRHRIEFYFSIYLPKHENPICLFNPCKEIGEINFFSNKEMQLISYKPDCLLELIQAIYENSYTFPKYLGNVK